MQSGRIIAAKTYRKFAKKYGIPIKKHSLKQLAQKIYKHEKREKKEGLYFYKEPSKKKKIHISCGCKS